jgi:hypothetical protein
VVFHAGPWHRLLAAGPQQELELNFPNESAP